VTEPAADRAAAPGDPFARYEARVLDPATAVRPRDGAAPATTVYRGDTLLVTAATRDLVEAAVRTLGDLAVPLDLRVAGPDVFVEIDAADGAQERAVRRDVQAHNRLARLLGLAEAVGVPLVVPVRFEPTIEGPASAVDVWPLLQALRDRDSELGRGVGLDHLMFSAAVISGNPYSRGMALIAGEPYSRGMAGIVGNPYSRGMSSGIDQYMQGGSGGHGPVSVVLAPPAADPDVCHPRVVVLDTGVGQHPWFTAAPVERTLQLDNGDHVAMDVDDPAVSNTDPEGVGAAPDPMTGMLAGHAGHGTFIAGLLRQSCPDADIASLRIMDGDGVVAEDELTQALTALCVRLRQQKNSIDALVLSLGYYAETDDAGYTAGLAHLLVDLAGQGVVTFAAAGNDCTGRRSYPAAFADRPEFDGQGVLPLLAVAALNPDGSVALFSNDADWVNGEAAGANVVSTAPVLASGAWSADTALLGPNGARRGTIDPDQFSSGFATWSGTSFAAPVLAGKYLAKLVEAGCPDGRGERRSLVPFRGKAAEQVDSP